MIILVILWLAGIDVPAGRCPGEFLVGRAGDGSYDCERIRFGGDSNAEFRPITSHVIITMPITCGPDEVPVTSRDAREVSCRKIRRDENGIPWIVSDLH